jgi:hypothetical protein
MRLNRKGVTRLVIELNSVVIKIPNFTCQWNHFLQGILANIKENQTYKYHSKRELLCPVLWCSIGGWILVMARAIPCNWDEDIDYSIWIKEDLGGDDKPGNYGHFNNRIVKIDYGQ